MLCNASLDPIKYELKIIFRQFYNQIAVVKPN